MLSRRQQPTYCWSFLDSRRSSLTFLFGGVRRAYRVRDAPGAPPNQIEDAGSRKCLVGIDTRENCGYAHPHESARLLPVRL